MRTALRACLGGGSLLVALACGGLVPDATEPAPAPAPAEPPPAPAPASKAPPPHGWPTHPPCDGPTYGPAEGASLSVLLPSCDVPEGSVRTWMALSSFSGEDQGYPNAPPEGVRERVCPDGTYEQVIPGIPGEFIVRTQLRDGRAEGPVTLYFGEDGTAQLQGAFTSGVPAGTWAWKTSWDTIGFGRCPSQEGRYAAGKREGVWTFQQWGDMGSLRAELTFVKGVIEGPVRADVSEWGSIAAWEGQARANERDGVWRMTGDGKLEGVSIVERWRKGTLVSRQVTPGPCAQVPTNGDGGMTELCNAP